MRIRRGDLGILLAGVAAFVLSLVAVTFVIDAVVDSDLSSEMEQTLEAIGRNIDFGTGLLVEEGAFPVGSEEKLREILTRAGCLSWASTGESHLLCFRRDGSRILSSKTPDAAAGETSLKVFANFAEIRHRSAGEHFRASVYGEECLCLLSDRDDCRLLVAVPVRCLSVYRHRVLTPVGVVFLLLVLGFMVGALRRSALLSRLRGFIEGERTRLSEDLSAAHLVQMSALPPPFPRQPAFSVSARMDPAKIVGGDFYDYEILPSGCFFFLVADVAGKGISAAMFMMRAKSVIKQCLAETSDLAKGMTKANTILATNNDSKMFVTVWVGILNPRTGRICYVNAGHNPPVIRHVRADGPTLEWVKCPPSLVMALLPDVRYPVHDVTLAPGDTLFLYTDGVTEAQDASGRLYGERRLAKVLSDSDSCSVESVRKDIDAFQGKEDAADDATMVMLAYTGTPPGTARGFPCNREVGFVESVRFLEQELARVSCPADIRTKFLVAYDEIGSNVVSYSGAEYFTLKVAFESTPQAITLTVTDSGKPFNPLDKSAPDVALPIEKRTSGGFGIFITRQLMDDVIYCRDEGLNVLTLRKLCRLD